MKIDYIGNRLKMCGLIMLCFVMCCQHVRAQSGKVYENQKFHDQVGVVQLYPVLNVGNEEMETPIIPIGQTTDLMLRFDMLTVEYENLQAKIIHCNADWTQSVLNDMEFMYDYNVFDIRDYEYSINTVELYVNYWMTLPKVKRSGNYIIQVYRDSRPDKVLFNRRFVVFEQGVNIQPKMRSSTSVQYRVNNQQIDFEIAYSGLQVNNPMAEFKVVLRQNNRWDNAIVNLRPTNVNRAASKLEYRHFNSENNFKGGNEFRFFDIRVHTFRGMNVAAVKNEEKRLDAFLVRDKIRSQAVYSQVRDMNGAFFIATNESGARYLEADYIHVHFDLISPETNDEVYVIGAFNDWRKDDKSRMIYNRQTLSYQASALLKQGFYDYMYWVDSDNPYWFENSYYQTENKYEIIVYYRGFTDLADKVVGYTSFTSEF
ncbi:DUF5103 domain-containing protein [Reichenbachiella agarivorans]|uniref:DUF5103 domain-containing protein n=1 Tax=Reichenbachiella agarivorans TaxID=2979464 RepID=A0ABY6CTD4_9BACT|nr:DUF5103 domain-containing protein [Reichenbachiella agarivorans]UXP33789.1 DUF5103 domain-containing protein [Reichenbachiella agarivorans]